MLIRRRTRQLPRRPARCSSVGRQARRPVRKFGSVGCRDETWGSRPGSDPEPQGSDPGLDPQVLLPPEPSDRIDEPVRVQIEDIAAGAALCAIRTERDPIDEQRALALTDIAATLEPDSRHVPLGAGDVWQDAPDALEEVEPPAPPNTRGG